MDEQYYKRELGDDLVKKIEEKVLLYVDKVRFRAVSKLWNSISPKMPNLRAKQLPWLLYQSSDEHSDASHGLFNPFDKSNYLLKLQECEGNYIGGSCFGWVLFNRYHERSPRDSDIHLINPLSKERVELPPRSNFYNSEIRKIIWSASPLSNDCVLASLDDSDELSFCRPGDKNWSLFERFSIVDIIFHKGKLHALTFEYKVIVFERLLNGRTFFKNSGPPVPTDSDGFHHLVESSDGELMVVNQESDHPSRFIVYKYDPVNSMWFRVKSIGDQVIFILIHDSLVISVSCRDFPEFKGNHVYFFADKQNGERGDGVCYDMFNLEDDTIGFGFQCGPMNDCYPAVWFTPRVI